MHLVLWGIDAARVDDGVEDGDRGETVALPALLTGIVGNGSRDSFDPGM